MSKTIAAWAFIAGFNASCFMWDLAPSPSYSVGWAVFNGVIAVMFTVATVMLVRGNASSKADADGGAK